MTTKARNMFDEVAIDTAPKTTEQEMESTAGALDNNDPNICVKCKGTMSAAKACGEPVIYCTGCRVTNPLPLT